MKKFTHKNKAILLLLCIVQIGLSSCLKEKKETYIDFANVGVTIELPLAALVQETMGSNKVQPQSYMASTTPSNLPVIVNVASPKPLNKDLVVTLAVNASDALAKFNTATKGTYVLLPSNAYTVDNLKVTIPSGQRTATVLFKINTAVVDKTVTNYVLPVSITDASGEQISNYSAVFYNVVVK